MILHPLIMFVVGFVTWFLVLLRGYALEQRHTKLLCSTVFIDELLGIGTGIYLARYGTAIDVMACAIGGTLAALVIMRKLKR